MRNNANATENNNSTNTDSQQKQDAVKANEIIPSEDPGITEGIEEEKIPFVFKAVWKVFIAMCICVLSMIAIYFIVNGAHKPVPREIIRNNTEAQNGDIIEARTDFSGMTEPVLFEDGSLVVPNNITIDDISTDKIITEICRFNIPKAWIGNVVIKTIKMDQTTDPELYEAPIQNTLVIQFYEKNTFKKYQTSEFVYEDDASKKGKITELYVSDSYLNDMEIQKKNPQKIYVADIQTNEKTPFSAFLYQMSDQEGAIDKEYKSEYGYLADIDYKGCIISSLEPYEGTLAIANAYIKTVYADEFDVNGEGMTEAGVIPKNYKPVKRNGQKKPEHQNGEPDFMQDKLDKKTPYQWGDFYSPWSYHDRGSSYPYAAMESGGEQIVIEQTENTDIDIGTPQTQTPTPTPTPTPAIDEEDTTDDIVTPDDENYEDYETEETDDSDDNEEIIDITGG